MVEYNPKYPIEEIERANAALEIGSAITWKQASYSKPWYDQMNKLDMNSPKDSKYSQNDGDWHFVLTRPKEELNFLLELKHQASLSIKEHEGLISCYVSKKWVENCDNPQYPRMAYGICLPRENTLYYCNSMKSIIKKAVKEEALTKTSDGKFIVKVPENKFKSVKRSPAKSDLDTWSFIQENSVKIYGRKKNYFEPEEEVISPIDNLIERKKREVSKLEVEIAELEEFKRQSKLLSDKYGEEIVG